MGGLIWYLRSLKLDQELLSAKNIHLYDPLRHSGTLVLDGQTLLNLEIFENSADGGSNGTLYKLLNQCVSGAGRIHFQMMDICSPCNFF
jgi:DNA mismatch repair protein MSH6